MSTEQELKYRIAEALKKVKISKTWTCDWDGWLEKKWKKLKERLGIK